MLHVVNVGGGNGVVSADACNILLKCCDDIAEFKKKNPTNKLPI